MVAGDTTEKALRGQAGGRVREVEGEARSPRPSCPRPRAPRRPPEIFLIDKADAPQSSIRVGLIGIERTSPDYFPVTVMNLILGGGFYRLDLNLREGKGWTYGARSIVRQPAHAGAVLGGRRVRRRCTPPIRSPRSSRRWTSMRDADVTDVELARAKDQIIKSFPARFATRGNVAAQLAELAVFGLPDSYITDYTKKIAAVTQGRRPPRRAQVPRPEPPHHRRRGRPQDAGRAARRSWRRSRTATSTAIRSPAGHDL